MGVRFLEEMDDLDELHIARYQVRGALASIQAYYLAPTGEYTLYVDVPGAKLDVLGLGNVARTMLESLGVTPDQIQWVNKPLFAE